MSTVVRYQACSDRNSLHVGVMLLTACNGPQTFESGLSGWTQSKADDFDWTLDVAGTGSFGTGPSVDHTFGTRLGEFGIKGSICEG